MWIYNGRHGFLDTHTCGLTFTWFYIPSLKFVKLKSLNQVTFPPQQNKGLIELFFRFYTFSKFVPSRWVQGLPGTFHGCADTYNLNSALKHKILPRSHRVISELQWGKIQNTIKGLTYLKNSLFLKKVKFLTWTKTFESNTYSIQTPFLTQESSSRNTERTMSLIIGIVTINVPITNLLRIYTVDWLASKLLSTFIHPTWTRNTWNLKCSFSFV